MRIILPLALACGAIQNGQAFAPSPLSAPKSLNSFVTRQQKTSSLMPQRMAPQPHDLIDIHTAATSITQASDLLHSQLSSVSTILADAAAATADATADDGGWWQTWLNVFKGTLIAVHSTIDGPLRAAGWDQTWGVSIFLFTA
eukprot:5286431-Ditylum_brightwellii.AAC.1